MMKTTAFIQSFSKFTLAMACVIVFALALTGCNDDEPKEIKLPTILFKQWIAPSDGLESRYIVYDLSKNGKMSILQMPTDAYAAEAGMLANNFYLTTSFPIEVEIDTKTGVIYILDIQGGAIKATNLTEGDVMFDGVMFEALTETVKSAGNWKYVNDKPLE